MYDGGRVREGPIFMGWGGIYQSNGRYIIYGMGGIQGEGSPIIYRMGGKGSSIIYEMGGRDEGRSIIHGMGVR